MSKLPPIIVAAALAFISPSAATASPVTSTFTFTGQCNFDCTGTGIGTLVLSGYMQGTDISNSNFVSFTYNSNLLSLSFSGVGSAPGEIALITGNLPVSLPATATVDIGVGPTAPGALAFSSSAFDTGSWCAGIGFCLGDAGDVSSWSATPLPAALPLFATALGGFGLLGWRRKRKAQAVA